MIVLGIETSCDETSVALVEDGRDVLANIVASQAELHRRYGGVFPEVASRQHVLSVVPVAREAMQQAQVGWEAVDAVAATRGPGLVGSLVVGLNFAKALAIARALPFIGVNHLEGHIYSAWLRLSADEPPVEPRFPALVLIVSGGHTELVLMHGHGQYTLLGHTLDDAAGEAFDKVARMLGLPYPGGPHIQRMAAQGNPDVFRFPRAWLPDTYHFSFSGLKTAVWREVKKYTGAEASSRPHAPPTNTEDLPVHDLAAGFQQAVVDVLVAKTVRAARAFNVQEVVLAGGVAANRPLREQLAGALHTLDIPLRPAPPTLCTDNAAMIAAAAYWRLRQGERSSLDVDAEPNLPLAAPVG
ncbi:MAG: tRNA (adenosine(37)-N6)-threonylcarbamoyltransferase complex transferase subunit TsaD [Ardenticatenia bacterium]|nr:tRNA (adenosine(37)-N6)-threonylcarbamoyltransferase complex transferase subunit TsaD [Ardenticatenia bacterium]